MAGTIQHLGMYLHLARASQRRRRPHVRDKLLVLAAEVASNINLPLVAEYCRFAVLDHNPGHMLKRWTTFSDAMLDDDFLYFLKQVRRRYPPEKAERMLDNLGIDMAHERDAYYTDQEYASSLLGISVESLEEMFGDGLDRS